MSGVALSTPAVCEVTGATYRRLHYWTAQRIVRPSIVDADGSGSRRVWSFVDAIVVRLIVVVDLYIDQLKAALPLVRRALAEHPDGPLWLVVPTDSTDAAVTTDLHSALCDIGTTAAIVVDVRAVVEEVRRAVAGLAPVAS